MSRRFAHCRVDANHGEAVETLRKLGWSVLSLAPMGQGCPDLLCGRPGFAGLVELKDGAKRKLTPAEQAFAEAWRGPLIVAYSGEDANRKLIELWRG